MIAGACCALISGGLFAGDSASPATGPRNLFPAQAPAPFPEELARDNQPATSVTPLDLPLSEFERGRASIMKVRVQNPAIEQEEIPSYFETGSVGQTPLITLTDFLQAAPPMEPVIGKPITPSLLPPEPTSAVIQLPVPEGSGVVPGMDDTVFRPISRIQPYYAYSPTGKNSGEYLCPQPSSLPDDRRARCPEMQPLPTSGATTRQFALVDYQWFATNLHHKPLYFEDVVLERYGQQYPCGIQPFVSIARFGVQGIGLPYQMAIDPVWQDIYALGYYRPGDNAPELLYQVPFNMKAAAAAGGVYTGLIFLIP